MYDIVVILTLNIDRRSPAPVYEQVADQLRRLIASGELRVGASLPPVRRLAGDLGVALNTIARAHRALVEEGVLVTEHRTGVRVAASARGASRAERTRRIDELRLALTRLAQAGLTGNELSALVDREIAALGSRERPAPAGED